MAVFLEFTPPYRTAQLILIKRRQRWGGGGTQGGKWDGENGGGGCTVAEARRGKEGESPAEKNTAEERGIMKHLNSRKKSSARVKVGCGEFVQNNMAQLAAKLSWFILTWR